MKLLSLLFVTLISSMSYGAIEYQGQPIQETYEKTASVTYSKAITFKNTGTSTDTLSISLSGADSSLFKISINRCNNVAATKTCQVTLASSRGLVARPAPYLVSFSGVSFSISVLQNGQSSPPPVSQEVLFSFSPASVDEMVFSATEKTKSVLLNIRNDSETNQQPTVSLSSGDLGVSILINRCTSALAPGKVCSVTLSVSSPISGTKTKQVLAVSNSVTKATLSLSASMAPIVPVGIQADSSCDNTGISGPPVSVTIMAPVGDLGNNPVATMSLYYYPGDGYYTSGDFLNNNGERPSMSVSIPSGGCVDIGYFPLGSSFKVSHWEIAGNPTPQAVGKDYIGLRNVTQNMVLSPIINSTPRPAQAPTYPLTIKAPIHGSISVYHASTGWSAARIYPNNSDMVLQVRETDAVYVQHEGEPTAHEFLGFKRSDQEELVYPLKSGVILGGLKGPLSLEAKLGAETKPLHTITMSPTPDGSGFQAYEDQSRYSDHPNPALRVYTKYGPWTDKFQYYGDPSNVAYWERSDMPGVQLFPGQWRTGDMTFSGTGDIIIRVVLK